jgi:hypothetical protein
MDHLLGFAPAAHRSRWQWVAGLVAIALLVLTMHATAQAPAAPAGAAPPTPTAQIDKLVGPIALYPDDLVAIILPASTNPLQIVQADRFLEKRKADPKLPVDDKWDDAVKSLLNYPDVVKMMSGDLDWTSALGEAVVADQGAVLEGIQSFRRRAQAAGNLKSDDKQVVKSQQEIIIIEPADPQVIYVPQYNPTTVVVYSAAPAYAYYPTPYPSYYYPYPPGAAFAAGVIWGAAIGAAWNGNHYNTNYSGNANININRTTNINTGNINTGNVNRAGGANAPAAGTSSAWSSNKQPGQVSSSVGKTAPTTRAGSTQAAGGAGAGAGAATRPSTQTAGGAGKQPAGGAATGAAARPSTQPSGGANAFGDYGSGRQAQMDSSRGAASSKSMSSAGARPAPSGGGRGGRR